MTQDVVRHVLASNVADAGTFVVGFPTNRDAGNYVLGDAHYLRSNKYGTFYHGHDVSFAFGATGVTITNNTGMTLEAQTEFWVNLDMVAADDSPAVADPATVMPAGVYLLQLGAPDTLDADGICEAQSPASAGDLDLDGDLVVDGVAILDVPRNVIADSGGVDDAVLTVYGTDIYGAEMAENITLNDTTAVSGKKAFKTVTRVACSKAIANGAFLGTGDVLGLPVALPSTGCVIKEMQDGAAATAGTVVAAVRTAATATTGDVRGTYDPNAAADGAKMFTLGVMLSDPSDRGLPQFAG